MKKIFTIAACLAFGAGSAMAQETFPRNGVYDERPGLVALTNATIHTDYKTTLNNATLVIRNGKVEAVGTNVKVPAGAVVVDAKGKHIYPGFVDMYSSYGLPEVKRAQRNWGSPPQMESNKQGAYNWNQAIRPETNAVELFKADKKQAEELRKQGFGTVLAIHQDGIARGTAALVTLADKRENEVIVLDKAAAALSFDKGSSAQDYPSSLMGSIALLRQTYLDAKWNAQNPGREQNISLKTFTDASRFPQIFEADDKLGVLRADKVGDEFKTQYIIKTKGDEYQMLKEVKATNAPLIVSVNYPDAYNVEDPYDARRVPLEAMKHWEMAASNAGLLQKAGITFAFTASDLKDKKDFLPNVRKAINYGLSEEEALKALTATPAKLLNAENLVGSLSEGKLANFIVTSGNLFANDNLILENWVQGDRYKITEVPSDYRGVYTLKIGNNTSKKLKIAGTPDKPELSVIGTDTVKGKISFSGNLVTLSFTDSKKSNETIRLSGWLADKNLQGEGQLPDASAVKWSATFSEAMTQQDKKDSAKKAELVEVGQMIYPFRAYGQAELPKQETILIKNATVWTNEKDGKLENTDVLLKNGKIAKVGKNLSESGAKVIDGTGKHVTPGIIDEHSHIALNAVNEGSQSVTAEVRMADVVNSDDINIYRQLAGGVTTSQLLHGSANPVGGQSAIIKLRWGKSPQDLMVDGADGFIKFALGENVKQSNRSNASERFPQSRMGVEQTYVDAFTRAKEYEQAWKSYNKLSKKQQAKAGTPRRDLELETLVEILNGKRFITCHSYVQSEINMMMKVADQMGFKVNTFTHILEGYKVADKMKEHGAGGSTFSDWWAYKMEVKDAIPQNAGIMHNLGVVTAINSDDAEMARRLNQEAAKSVKYAGVSEEDALKMVTLNPAKLLHLDDRMGSLKAGKDADVVLWNNHPLSIYARPEKTFVDGVAYFDAERDAQLQQDMEKERMRLIQKMLTAKAGGAKTQNPTIKKASVMHCEDVEHHEEESYLAY
ncbi:amidohydrolase family protein [Pontibacter sp. BT310]|uniref:Amidohydrolase family protein n=1 Tax=Pontibacter populi TaxID=890055 RepID=A0ABS6X6J0_9BACT|nr:MULTISPECIES: amidohydrolase family protein [Pontibacter]MBJ6116754.1 amidohydrolase family protein [Pontibacter sp. BT310]MBR0569176.1 amidohydrolase family protein [Microvirga sp. STS03]MBW3363607.1 amidohydrolase family protein [Pontibacter populi]